MADQKHDTPPEGPEDGFIAFISKSLRKPERLDDETFEPRLMAAVRTAAAASDPAQRPGLVRTSWWRRPRTVHITPVTALAAAAAFIAIAVLSALLGVTLTRRSAAVTVAKAERSTLPGQRRAQPDTVYVVRFVLVAPSAKSVSLVGDFNNWNQTAARLVSTGANGVWTIAVPLTSGRYEYAFIVDDSQWLADRGGTRV